MLARAGDLAGAIAAYEEVLTDQVRILGPEDHPQVPDTRDQISYWRAKAGDPERVGNLLPVDLPGGGH